MTPQEFESRLAGWARRQTDIVALVQFGSRVQAGGAADALSDWDYQLICARPQKYNRTEWLSEIEIPWCAHVERRSLGVIKVSAVFEGGLEADIVLMTAWHMKLVHLAMARPELGWLYPAVLRQGIFRTRLMVGPGYKLIVGGQAWEDRLRSLAVSWPEKIFSPVDFQFHVSAFWRHAVWVHKKIARGESRAALRWQQVELTDHVYALLAEEARLAGRPARPEARKAEQWLDAKRLVQTDIATGTDQRVLARALLAEMVLFEEVSQSVAGSRGFVVPDHSAVAAWLRAELTKLTGRS